MPKKKLKTDQDADAKEKADQVTKKSDEAKLAKEELEKGSYRGRKMLIKS